MTTYSKLSGLVNRKQVELIIIIAPPRTGSTMLQAVLAKSSSVDIWINDPQEDVYQQTYHEALNALTNQKRVTILVKVMTHWIYPRIKYKKLFALADKVVISIRNPLLSTESKIKKFIDSLTIKPIADVHQWLLSYISTNKGLSSWSNVKEEHVSKADLVTQKKLLDMYAWTEGYRGWDDMINISYPKQNYSCLEGILRSNESSNTGFSMEQLGWESLGEEVKYLCEVGAEPIIVDSTDFRLMPKHVSREICRKLEMSFDRVMISGWKKTDFSHLITEKTPKDREIQYAWYKTLSESKGVKPPSERSPNLNSFPKYIRKYIAEVAMPIYIDLYRSPYKIQIKGRVLKDFSFKNVDPYFSNLYKLRSHPRHQVLETLSSL